MKDSDQTETRTMKFCRTCSAGLLERDRFCRRCGANQSLGAADMESAAAPAKTTSPLAHPDAYHKVSGPLVKAVTAAASGRTSLQFYNRFAATLVLTLISIPVWLIIVLLSPLDAYAAARDVSIHLARR